MSTKAKDYESSIKERDGADFWDQMESQVVMKMEKMNLEDLLGLLWSALEVEKGSATFFNELENQLNKRLLKV